MPAEQQVEAVSKKLMKLNPEFDGKVTPKVEKGLVTEMKFMTDTVTDISPVRALSGVMTLACQGSKFNGILADVSPLQGMPLTTLSLAGNPKLSEISPLRGMPLSSLDIYSCIPVTDIEPLKGMQLMFLSLGGTQTRDLTPLKGMRLKTLNLLDCPLRDLSPLIGMPLEDLYFFSRSNTKVTDLSPLKQLPLKKLVIDFQPERDIEILRSIKTLEKINEKPAAEFWKEVEEKQSAKKP
jgi:Leucine-rich repeat (LRR) protein